MTSYRDDVWKTVPVGSGLVLDYTCGFCHRTVSSEKGWDTTREYDSVSTFGRQKVRICPSCNRPTHFLWGEDDELQQTPGTLCGRQVDHLPDGVEAVYEEARRCMSVSAYTAAALLCRKLLMNVAVEHGAEEGKDFKHYVGYLCREHLAPKGAGKWIEYIRNTGGAATHELEQVGRTEAERTLTFVNSLLHMVFELPGQLPDEADGG